MTVTVTSWYSLADEQVKQSCVPPTKDRGLDRRILLHASMYSLYSKKSRNRLKKYSPESLERTLTRVYVHAYFKI